MKTRELAELRSIPLATVLEGLGATRDAKDPTRNWRYGESRITVTDSRFYDHNRAGAVHRMRTGKPGGGGAIDLVQYLKNVSLPDAARELSHLAASGAVRVPDSRTAAPPVREARPAPQPATDRSGRARWYLTVARGVPERLVDEVLESGKVFTDTRGNVVFRLSDETGREVGYEVRGTSERPYHSVHGVKGLFILKADSASTVAFVESAIEALSYRALRGTGLVVSTTGSAVELPARFAEALKGRGYELVSAFNADAAGDRMSQTLSARVSGGLRRDRPPGGRKDWNELLQHHRAGRSSIVERPPDAFTAALRER